MLQQPALPRVLTVDTEMLIPACGFDLTASLTCHAAQVLRSIESDRQEREERLERQRAAASATAAVAQTKASLVGSPAAKDKEI